MSTYTYILPFLFGVVIGSFLNVVSLRFNSGRNLGGRSKCMSCGKTLTWIELIPILSFLFQRGACRGCRSKISWQYPLIEFISGIVFVLIFIIFPPLTTSLAIQTLFLIVISCILVVITIYDVKHKIIPDSLSFSFGFLSLLTLFVGGSSIFHMPTILNLLSGPIVALPFVFIWLISKGSWMGLGDGKLVIGIGWLLGLGGAINAIILAFWISAVVSVAWLYYKYGKFKASVEIPFGPYLIIGMYIVLFFKITVIDTNVIMNIIK